MAQPSQLPTIAALRRRTALRTLRRTFASRAERPEMVTAKLLICWRGGQLVLPAAQGSAQKAARLVSSVCGATLKAVTASVAGSVSACQLLSPSCS